MASFRKAVVAYGVPAQMLSDNGAVFTGIPRSGGRVALELEVRVLSETGELLRELTLDPARDYQPQPKA